MSRRKRWEPPHPDPARVTTSTRKKPRSVFAPIPIEERCVWAYCQFRKTELRAERVPGISKRFDLCDLHLAEAAACYEQNRERVNRSLDTGKETTRPDLADGTIYYARIDDTIKIGFTTDLDKRMRQYPPTSQLLATEPGTKKLEKVRHSLFAVYLAHGREWFTPNPELDAWINELVDKHGRPEFEYPAFRRPGDKKPVVGGKHFTFDRAV